MPAYHLLAQYLAVAMSAAKPAVVGGFVLGALLIGVVGALVLGGTRWFRPTIQVTAVFKDSVAGLNAGSPVTFRGVAIGKVRSIKVHASPVARAPVVQVRMELEPDRLSLTDNSTSTDREDLKAALQSGLRAQLISQSLVTGELNVDLDFYPELPPVAVVASDEDLQIPTVASELQTFKDQVRDMNLPDIASRTRAALISLTQDLEVLKGVIGPVSADMRATLRTTTAAVSALEARATRTLDGIDKLTATGQLQLKTNGDELQLLLLNARRVTAQTEQLATSLNDITTAGSPMREDLEAALRDLAASSSSLRLFTHDLQSNPAGTLLRHTKP
jgi:paraquat-inducible protein B